MSRRRCAVLGFRVRSVEEEKIRRGSRERGFRVRGGIEGRICSSRFMRYFIIV